MPDHELIYDREGVGVLYRGADVIVRDRGGDGLCVRVIDLEAEIDEPVDFDVNVTVEQAALGGSRVCELLYDAGLIEAAVLNVQHGLAEDDVCEFVDDVLRYGRGSGEVAA